jgi:DNA-binding IclR family transcriptional regulator
MSALNQRKVYQAARGPLNELAEDLNETGLLITEEQGRAVYLYRARSPQSFQSQIEIGQHTPLHHLAAGKAILAYYPRERVDEILRGEKLNRFTERTVVDREELEARFERIRERGYALNLEESIEGLHAVSAPIRGNQTEIVGAVSVSGPAHRLTEDRIETEVADKLLSVANEIELDLRTEEWTNLSQ